MNKEMNLVNFLAKACYYAQEHIDDPEAWSTERDMREQLLQCTSFQVACFLAQNTVDGDEGVDWYIIINELAEHPMKSEQEWVEILNEKAKMFGGWTKN